MTKGVFVSLRGLQAWKGGAGEFYRGGDWRSQQRLAHKTYGNECICCGQKTYNGNKTQVHHVVPYRLSKNNEIEKKIYDPNFNVS